MPSFSRVRRAGKCDCSTSRMISVLSDAECLMPRLPHPRSCFFERRFSRVRSATTSFNACASRRRSFASSEVAARAVSPASRLLSPSVFLTNHGSLLVIRIARISLRLERINPFIGPRRRPSRRLFLRVGIRRRIDLRIHFVVAVSPRRVFAGHQATSAERFMNCSIR